MADLALHLADMAAWPPWEGTRDWLEANELFRNEVLDVLDADGPLLSREVHATAQVPWRSSGWNADRNVRTMLSCLLPAVRSPSTDGAARSGGRTWPSGSTRPASRRCRARRRAGAATRRCWEGSGMARARGTVLPGGPIHVGEAGEPAVVEGTDGRVAGRPRPARACRSRVAPLCCRRSTRSSATGCGWRTSSSSTTSWRCTSPPRSGAGATSRCRSCTATGWSGSSTRPPTARPAGSSSTRSTRTRRSPRPMTAAVDAEIRALAGWLGLTLER